ncbi:MAG: aminotransferase class III-fold pyridoxal phosphate-dependent enzyme [Alphaproteobacteria bacterium]
MKTVAIIQARMGSTRLPGKVLMDLGGLPVLAWAARAARQTTGVDEVMVATSVASADDAVADWCKTAGIACHRGPEDDVLRRYVEAAAAASADVVVRLTADSPLLDPAIIAQLLYLRALEQADYSSNVDPPRWPDGLDCEAFTATALRAANELARRTVEREHVTPFLRHNRRRFAAAVLTCPIPGLWRERWTLDTAEDLAFLRAVAARLAPDHAPSYVEILRVLDAEPALREINAAIGRNEGYSTSLLAEAESAPAEQRSYSNSVELLERAERVIPLGSQTFSKSRAQFPIGAAPLFLTHGEGGRVWDVDGNEYVDLVNSLLCVSLGYRDPDVDAAIARQLAEGISFSLATERERELAELLVEIVPCAEKVRFAKNGSDATAGAVRIARAATGRDRIAVCGYHGWQDWYIGATARHKGVPEAVRALTHSVPYNDLDAVHALLKKHPGELAGMVMEPMNVAEPKPGYLAELKALLNQHGALLIFDEIITGFRFSLGGAQEYFGVAPDLAAFGKGLSNGMPLSAVVGRAEIMAQMEEVFFSGTFGGETLSLAAGLACLRKMQREPVIETLWRNGKRLAEAVGRAIHTAGLQDTICLRGMAPWTLLAISDHPNGSSQAIKTMLIYELAARGVLGFGSHNVSFAHNEADLRQAAMAYAGALSSIREALEAGRIESRMRVPPLEPVFRVR